MKDLIGIAALGELPAELKVRSSLPCRTCASSMWEFHKGWTTKMDRDVEFKRVSCYCLQKHDLTWNNGGTLTRCSIHPVS